MRQGGATALAQYLALVLLSLLALEAYFALRIALMTVIDPESTTFQRSEAWRLATGPRPLSWQQRWIDYDAMAPALKRAVIASEDAGFVEHSGVEWDALEKAWNKNAHAEAVVERAGQRAAPRQPARSTPAPNTKIRAAAKVVGGSTITQQLAKNVFLSGERSLLRKGQELVLAYEMEALLGKRRILEIYLDSVEWGEGVFGAEAAARRYFHIGAGALSVAQAAQLAVLLPAPKRFEKRPGSPYVLNRAATVAARMEAAVMP